ncbi:MAG: hypothetical protein Q4A06_10770, partial [Cardiobacteriaceae bacterium]|nr:hypothetical protein [Cardiobacteriaceae bacterium]
DNSQPDNSQPDDKVPLPPVTTDTAGANLFLRHSLQGDRTSLKKVADFLQAPAEIEGTTGDAIILKQKFFQRVFGDASNVPDNTLTLAGNKLDINGLTLAYKGEKLFYQEFPEVNVLHYYGRLGTDIFSVVHTHGTLAHPKAIHDLKTDSAGHVTYQGPTSFRSHDAGDINEALERGEATIVLRHHERKLDATIKLPTRLDKTYQFHDISYAGEVEPHQNHFAQDGAGQGIRGYFYGNRAQYIGGAYYVPEGGGAFITKNVSK